ncbi:MAG: glutaredoxin 3 [Candidatus Binatia bacterium]|nr:glutaredoxin 3 [Candidatus Binatia bacterium]
MKPVVVYTTTYCPFCVSAKALLQAKGIPFQEIDVTNDVNLRQEVIRRSGRRTVPQIFIDDEPIGGFTELKALADSGELDAKLAD